MKYIILHISFLITLCCCQETKLEKALQLAENNRKELEKVLTHYSIHPKDSLKYKAACFLIENMPGHYTTNRIRHLLRCILRNDNNNTRRHKNNDSRLLDSSY